MRMLPLILCAAACLAGRAVASDAHHQAEHATPQHATPDKAAAHPEAPADSDRATHQPKAVAPKPTAPVPRAGLIRPPSPASKPADHGQGMAGKAAPPKEAHDAPAGQSHAVPDAKAVAAKAVTPKAAPTVPAAAPPKPKAVERETAHPGPAAPAVERAHVGAAAPKGHTNPVAPAPKAATAMPSAPEAKAPGHGHAAPAVSVHDETAHKVLTPKPTAPPGPGKAKPPASAADVPDPVHDGAGHAESAHSAPVAKPPEPSHGAPAAKATGAKPGTAAAKAEDHGHAELSHETAKAKPTPAHGAPATKRVDADKDAAAHGAAPPTEEHGPVKTVPKPENAASGGHAQGEAHGEAQGEDHGGAKATGHAAPQGMKEPSHDKVESALQGLDHGDAHGAAQGDSQGDGHGDIEKESHGDAHGAAEKESHGDAHGGSHGDGHSAPPGKAAKHGEDLESQTPLVAPKPDSAFARAADWEKGTAEVLSYVLTLRGKTGPIQCPGRIVTERMFLRADGGMDRKPAGKGDKAGTGEKEILNSVLSVSGDDGGRPFAVQTVVKMPRRDQLRLLRQDQSLQSWPGATHRFLDCNVTPPRLRVVSSGGEAVRDTLIDRWPVYTEEMLFTYLRSVPQRAGYREEVWIQDWGSEGRFSIRPQFAAIAVRSKTRTVRDMETWYMTVDREDGRRTEFWVSASGLHPVVLAVLADRSTWTLQEISRMKYWSW